MRQFGFVGGAHDHEAGKLSQIADVEGAGMRRSVGADQAGAVDGEAHGQALDGHVVHHLVVAALQKCRINRAERLDPVGGEAGGEGDGVLFGDADVEGSIRESFGEQIEARARRHGGGDGDDLVVALGLLDQFLREHLGIGRRVGLGGFVLRSGDHVELGDGVVLVGGVFGGTVALALLRHHMDQHRPIIDLLHVFEHRHEVFQIVAIDRADVVKSEFLEQGAAGRHAAGVFLGLLGHVGEGTRQVAGHFLAQFTHPLIGTAGDQLGEVGAHAADGRGDRHVVVVENDDQAFGGVRGVIHRLVGHARAHRAVADYRDHRVVFAAQITRHGEAERRRDRGRRVRRPEGVVLAFRALGKARQPAALAQGSNAVAPSGHDLVRIGLMSDVPDQDVPGRVEHGVQSDGQLDHAQAGPQMASGDGDGADGFCAHVVGQTFEVREVQNPGAGG